MRFGIAPPGRFGVMVQCQGALHPTALAPGGRSFGGPYAALLVWGGRTRSVGMRLAWKGRSSERRVQCALALHHRAVQRDGAVPKRTAPYGAGRARV